MTLFREGKEVTSRHTRNIVTLQGLSINTFGDRNQTNNFNLWYPLIFTGGAITINSTAQASGVTEYFNRTKSFFQDQILDSFFWQGSTLLTVGDPGSIIGGALVTYPGNTPSSFPAVDQLWGGGNFASPIAVLPGDELQFTYIYNTRFQDNQGSIP